MADRRQFLRGVGVVVTAGLTGCSVLDGDEGRVEDGGPERGDERPDAEEASATDRERAYERAIHERVNEVRGTHGREPLSFNEGLAAVARAHSVDMARRGYFDHVSPDGTDPADRLAEFFPTYCRNIGENIADVGLVDADPSAVGERVVSAWMDSAGHRENVLRERFDEEGVGVTTREGRVLATQNLCGTTEG